MTLKRFAMIIAVALIAAAVPVAGKADGSAGLRLSTASCAEADCGSISKVDCICPDMQMNNRKPRCVEP
ncbi:hypothetical protein [Candidatus Palauibacter polyketidifaciens]|uniref:hypothetical protein n=1 Tax=Candidatus Palauibacter polyketidifaciens TaxID=3056740 RepID=UPI0022C59D32|nr:hypothetical protein [Candidatus Palauibacter polyketidifaciens]MCZ0936408.1 hypothetical protein [Candidatus Palauibacter rhopaloidicola]MDE2719047.1 hypothetical protein [Candidatus Palauibacter polyketidifaciens]